MKKTAIAAILLVVTSVPGLGAGYDDLNAAISYMNQERYDDAIIWFTKALDDGDLIPDQKRIAYLDRGIAYASKEDVKNALTDYGAAIGAQPDHVLAYEIRARAYMAMEDLEKACADYQALLKLRPRDYGTRMIFGWMSWQLGRYEAAADAFYFFANSVPEAWLWFQLANARMGKPLANANDDLAAKYLAARVVAKTWPNPMKRLFKGEISEADALSDAPEKEACEANLYAGLWRLVHHDGPGAAPLLRVAQGRCEKDNAYQRIAELELKKVDGAK